MPRSPQFCRPTCQLQPSAVCHTMLVDDQPYALTTCNAMSVRIKSCPCFKQTSRSIIRAAWLHLLPGVHLRSIYQVVSLGSSSLSEMGNVILGSASRLDAVSASPFLT